MGVVDRYGRWFHVSRGDLQRVEQWLERWGKWTLTFGYFVPGVRHFTALVAGSSRLPARTFALFAYSGALMWCTTFITLGWYVGARWEAALASVASLQATLAVVLVAVAVAYALAHRWWCEGPGDRTPRLAPPPPPPRLGPLSAAQSVPAR
jgi:membrane protein DedA with SNARE-associated domain